jgi:hypothetical protein
MYWSRVHTFLEMGMACVGLFRVLSSSQDSQGDLISEWEAVLGGPYSTGAAIRWRTVRVWKQRVVIAERIEALTWRADCRCRSVSQQQLLKRLRVLSPVAICGDSAQKEQIAHPLERYEGIADTIVELFQTHGSSVIASSPQQIKPHSKRGLPPAINIKVSLNRLDCV